ncbi:hypothetical protein [Hyphomicrobium sp. NDB2Meth4]|uniref:hypothetical protein n=1 Tax=Hyphomicrobium sp. NDB2Meth4 TaxID=1892846 RepID=UPI0009316C8E|nr:hypothetical protein [Hyphomicrobium sp. NDB2Meth4]
MRLRRPAVWLAGLILPAAAIAQGNLTSNPSNPPDIDCSLGFEALRAAVQALPSAQTGEGSGFDVVMVSRPDVWRAEISITTSWHPAYPAVTMRTFRKQVTGVWTAQSKSCGYGDQGQFAALVEQMKAGDKALTDASRAAVDRAKASKSPLAPPN